MASRDFVRDRTAEARPNRRGVVSGLALATLMPPAGGLAAPPAFGEPQVQALARDLAGRPYAPPPSDLPAGLAGLDYDGHRDIRFDPARALWRADGLPFQLQFFHRGGLFRERVLIFEIQGGQARPIAYSPDQFRFKRGAPGDLQAELGFAGFRIHAPINRTDYYDEVAAFLGASYFRAVARGQVYGLSARALAIGTGEREEFPVFRSFWIERPAPGARSLTVLALLDSESCAGAWRFVITPGETTVFEVQARLFPRRPIANAGIAPLTSMFLFAGDAARHFDDFRPEVHDSDGLAVANGAGERLWRPLVNPPAIQTSALADHHPRGFGLIQRERSFRAYEDLEARYDRRPSLWVEPAGAWGAGEVRLVELPTRTEYEDNISAFWTPRRALAAGVETRFAYRLLWGGEPAAGALARVVQTRAGAAAAGRRRFVLDFTLPAGVGPAERLAAQVSAGAGRVLEINLQSNPELGGARLSFELDPGPARSADLRASLNQSGKVCSEVWLYKWTA